MDTNTNFENQNTDSKKSTTFFVVIALVVLAVAISFYFNKTAPKPEVKNQPSVVITPTVIKNTLLSTSKITFPQQNATSSVSKSDLPKQLTFLILPEAAQIKYSKISYQNDKVGYEIAFTKETDYLTVFNDFLYLLNKTLPNKQSEWNIINNLYADEFGLLEFENATMQSQVSVTSKQQNSSDVLIRIIFK